MTIGGLDTQVQKYLVRLDNLPIDLWVDQVTLHQLIYWNVKKETRWFTDSNGKTRLAIYLFK